MKELGNVCLRCRFRLLAASRSRTLYQTTKSSFFSTSASEAQPQDEARNRTPKSPSEAPIPASGPRQRHERRPAPAAIARKPQRPAQPDGSSSLAMFRSIVGKDTEPLPSDLLPSATENISLVRDVARIQTMVFREGAAIADAYAFFEQTIYPQITTADGVVPRIVKEQLGNVLFPKLVAEKARDFTANGLPSVSRITQLLVQLDILRPVLWGNLMIQLVDVIWKLNTSPADYSSIQSYETAMAQRDALLHDLIGAWKVFWPQAHAISTPESTGKPISEETQQTTGDSLADSKVAQHRQRRPQNGSFQNAFAELFPEHRHGSMLRPSWAALATYGLLSETTNHIRALQQKAYPFLEAMRKLIASSRLPVPKGQKTILFDGCPEALGSLLHQFLYKSRGNNNAERKPLSPPRPGSRSEADIIHQDIGRAIKARNLKALNNTWVKFWGQGPGADPARLAQLQKMTDIFDYFIFAYMSMRQIQLSISVWSAMAEFRITPTIKTWTSMMQGCTKANNPHGIKTVWNRLVASGTQLDTPAWTARISGLIMSGDLEGGIAALEEMGRVWRDREQPGNAHIAVKPSVEPINAAIAWLLRLDRISTVHNILTWAVRQGISPDTYTFNTMLRPLVRAGRNVEVHNVLEMMREHGIHADGATFTILLDGALADISTKTPEEQVEVVTRLIRDVESTGIDVNMHIYGKMVYILLEECGSDGDGAAVNAVLAHIWGRGLELSSHIYTMLAEHYFSRDPPDAAAVTALIKNRRLHSNRNIDRVFWERVIKGYCQVGETQRALDIFDRLFKTGSTITFSTLYEFLQALVDESKRDQAAQVVRAAKEFKEAEEEEFGSGKTKRYWRHRFWHLADQQGLLEEGLQESFRDAMGSN